MWRLTQGAIAELHGMILVSPGNNAKSRYWGELEEKKMTKAFKNPNSAEGLREWHKKTARTLEDEINLHLVQNKFMAGSCGK